MEEIIIIIIITITHGTRGNVERHLLERVKGLANNQKRQRDAWFLPHGITVDTHHTPLFFCLVLSHMQARYALCCCAP